jgi:hypothetical protein
MKLTPRKAVLACLGLLVGGALLWLAVVHRGGERRLSDYKQQLRAAGEKLLLSEVLPAWLPPEKNSASVFNQAMGFINSHSNVLSRNLPAGMRPISPGKALVGWSQPAVLDDKTSNCWSDIETALAEYQPAFDLLHEITQRPAMYFRLDYAQGYSLLLPHLSQFRRAAMLLTAAALRDLRHNDPVAATGQVRAVLALARSLRGEPLVISQLVRLGVVQIAFTATWELLHHPGLTDEQLAALQKDWLELDFAQPAEDALLLERGMVQEMGNRMRASSAEFRRNLNAFGSGGGGPGGDWFEQAGRFAKSKVDETRWRATWADQDELAALKGQQVLIEALRQARSPRVFKTALLTQQSRLSELHLDAKPDDLFPVMDDNQAMLRNLFSQGVASLSGVIKRVLTAEVARQLAVTALVLQRYHLQHNAYPDRLEALKPDFLADAPFDPADGQLLRFRLNPDGTFLLYSIGPDLEDNGGDAAPATNPAGKSGPSPWSSGRDLAWPVPASDADAKAFYDKLGLRNGRS